jgi:hypothetical protein
LFETNENIGILEDRTYIGKIPVVLFGTKEGEIWMPLNFLMNGLFDRNFAGKLTLGLASCFLSLCRFIFGTFKQNI